MTLQAGLAAHVADWSPSPLTAHDDLAESRAQEISATLDRADVPVLGDPLPPLWQWAYFLDWVPTSHLGVDGHPREGSFLPPVPHRRRMFGGGRIDVLRPLTIGRETTRESRILNKAVKSGRTGELLFVTVEHRYRQGGDLRMTEEQDLVYRSDEGSATPFTATTEPLAPPTMPWGSTPDTTATLLFRFSALTGNAHRIHYDETYTTQVEGFPALVVHGPLLALYMAELAGTHAGTIRTFDFRLTRPIFLGDAYRVQGGRDSDGSASLAVVTGGGTVHATATATFAQP